MYIAKCQLCKAEGIDAAYVGETCKSVYRRVSMHYTKLKSLDPSNFMVRHNILTHPELDPTCGEKYSWEVESFCKSALEREIREALLIKDRYARESGTVLCLNGKEEYCRSLLPGTSRISSEEDNLKEENLTRKILAIKKSRHKLGPTTTAGGTSSTTGA